MKSLPVIVMHEDETSPASVQQYRAGMIQSDHHEVVEDCPDEMRDVALESELDLYDEEYAAACEAFDDAIYNDEDGLESFDRVTKGAAKLATSVVKLFDTKQDRAFRIIEDAGKLKQELRKFSDSDGKLTVKAARLVHVDQSIEISKIMRGLDNNRRVGTFIAEQYKTTVRSHLDRAISSTEKHMAKNYLNRIASMREYRKEISQVQRSMSETVSVDLKGLLVGAHEARQLVGGWVITRVDDWKDVIKSFFSFLAFTSMPTLSILRVIKFKHNSYAGDGVVSRVSRSDLQKLLDSAKGLAELSLVKQEDVFFSVSEYQDVVDRLQALSENVDTDASYFTKFKNKVKQIKSSNAIEEQIKAASSVPARIIERNLIAAEGLLSFVEEIIESSQEGAQE